jgi:hypothetical protein
VVGVRFAVEQDRARDGFNRFDYFVNNFSAAPFAEIRYAFNYLSQLE